MGVEFNTNRTSDGIHAPVASSYRFPPLPPVVETIRKYRATHVVRARGSNSQGPPHNHPRGGWGPEYLVMRS